MENSVDPSTSGQLRRVHLVSGPLNALLKVHSKLLDHPEYDTHNITNICLVVYSQDLLGIRLL